MADDSTTESEYFDEGGDQDELPDEDALGGVSIQSSTSSAIASTIAPTPEPHIKFELAAPPLVLDRHAPALKAEPPVPPPPPLPPQPSTPSVARDRHSLTVKAEPPLLPPPPPPQPSAPPVHRGQHPTTVKPEPWPPLPPPLPPLLHSRHAPPLKAEPPPPHSAPASHSTASQSAAYTALKTTLPLRAGGLRAPPLPAQRHHMPAVGYQPPPRVDYAPPLYQSLASTQSGSQSSRQGGTACRVCRAPLVHLPDLKVGRECRCCGWRYPFAHFPKQDHHEVGPRPRCYACYKAWLATPVATKTGTGTVHANRGGPSTQLPSLTPAKHPFPVPASVAAPQSVAAAHPPSVRPAPPPSAPALSAPTTAPATMPVSTRASGSVAATVRVASTCQRCKRAQFRVPAGTANLVCRCCSQLLPRELCFSKSQRKESKRTCKACLGNVIVTSAGFQGAPPTTTATTTPPLPSTPHHPPLSRKQTLKEHSVQLGAEREVAKYHAARRALQRKREANDLRGATRVEYEQQLATEELALEALEEKLRAKHPTLLHAIRLVPPMLPRNERDRPLKRKAAAAAVAGIRAELAGIQPRPKPVPSAARVAIANVLKKRKKVNPVEAAAVAVMRSLQRKHEAEAATTTPTPTPTTARRREAAPPSGVKVVTLSNGRRVSSAVAAAKQRTAKATAEKAAAKLAAATTRKAAAAAEAAFVATTEPSAATGKRKAASAVITIDDDGDDTDDRAVKKHKSVSRQAVVDPWLAAQDDIAQGLAKILGGGDLKALSSRASITLSAADVKPTRKPTDPSTYAPKTKLEAATPPPTTVVTRARRRPAQPVEIIEILD